VESAASSAAPPHFQLPLSSHGLGLEAYWIHPYWESIHQLPEIPRALAALEGGEVKALNNNPLDDLVRAENVFRSLYEGGGEHRAALALLAEVQHRTGAYRACDATLQNLRSYNADDPGTAIKELVSLSLARAKALWYGGDAEAALAVCDHLLLDVDSGPVGLTPLQEASARTGQALGRLLQSTETLDDVFSLRDPFRMVVKSLERSVPASIPLALAHLNYGVAEAYYAHVVEKENGVTVPVDAALRSWKQGLTVVQRSTSRKIDPATTVALEARLLGNMAWGLLHAGNAEQASEFAGKALKLYDRTDVAWSKEGMGRALALVATCYHKSSGAVTSEGLFQSAIDDTKQHAWSASSSSSLHKLELADSYARYADLCRDWDRREGDAKRLDGEARRLRESLPTAFQAKPSVCGSLWFWTPSLR
jgi:tetratricopeptide (TPR) repeat protein